MSDNKELHWTVSDTDNSDPLPVSKQGSSQELDLDMWEIEIQNSRYGREKYVVEVQNA